METSKDKTLSAIAWVSVAVVAAIVLIGTFLYIGWFNNKTHVDTPAGDNVMNTYVDSTSEASPAAAAWNNAEGQSLRQEIVDPQVSTQTPVSAETPNE